MHQCNFGISIGILLKELNLRIYQFLLLFLAVYSLIWLGILQRTFSRGAPLFAYNDNADYIELELPRAGHAPLAASVGAKSHLFHLFHLNASLRANFRSNVFQRFSLLEMGGHPGISLGENFFAAIVEDSRTRGHGNRDIGARTSRTRTQTRST